MTRPAQRKHPALSPAIRQWIRSKPLEWQEDLTQEAELSLIELRLKNPEEDESFIEAQCHFALAQFYRSQIHIVDLLPTRASRRLYRLLQEEGAALLSSQADDLAEKHQSQPGLVRHVIRVLQVVMGGGIREDFESLDQTAGAIDPFKGMDTAESLRRALGQLTGREAEVIADRYLAEPPLSQGEVATKFGVSQPRVHTLEKRALSKLKEYLTA